MNWCNHSTCQSAGPQYFEILHCNIVSGSFALEIRDGESTLYENNSPINQTSFIKKKECFCVIAVKLDSVREY